jgi:murein DD-endopeptidase MepM/ murein hydrolase activator NlpD
LLDSQRDISASGRREVLALTDKAQRLERLLETLTRQSQEEPVGPSGGIRPWKGVLDWPARGVLVETFGRHRHPKFDTWTISNGISLSLSAGTPVRAVYSGKAVYARWLAEYGNLVILDHGDSVFTLYAWLQGIAVAPGAYVPPGGTIGWAGVGPGRDEAGLYFEVRDRQKAADLGVRAGDIASALRTMVGGEKVGFYREACEQYDVRLRLQEEYRSGVGPIAELAVPGADGLLLRLSNVATLAAEGATFPCSSGSATLATSTTNGMPSLPDAATAPIGTSKPSRAPPERKPITMPAASARAPTTSTVRIVRFATSSATSA